MWAADKRAAEIVRPAPVQSADSVPPKSLARDVAFAKLQSRILVAAEAVQAAKPHSEMPPELHVIMLSAGGPGGRAGRPHVTDRSGAKCAMEDGHGATSVQRQMQARAPRVLCGKAMMGICASNLWLSTLSHPFCCQYGGARTRLHRAVQHTLRRLSEQAGVYADLERHVPELYDWVSPDAVRHLRRCLLLPGRPGTTLDKWQESEIALNRGSGERTVPHTRFANGNAIPLQLFFL